MLYKKVRNPICFQCFLLGVGGGGGGGGGGYPRVSSCLEHLHLL